MAWNGRKIARLANQVVATYGSTCWLCGNPIDLTAAKKSPWGLTVDHVLPRSRGGTDDLCNLRPAHHRCNVKRQAKPVKAPAVARAPVVRSDWPGLFF